MKGTDEAGYENCGKQGCDRENLTERRGDALLTAFVGIALDDREGLGVFVVLHYEPVQPLLAYD